MLTCQDLTPNSITFGSYGAYIDVNSTNGSFNIYGGYTGSTYIDVNFSLNRLIFGGYLGRAGKLSSTVDGNTHNTFWTGSQWIAYVDTTQVFNTYDRRIKQNV